MTRAGVMESNPSEELKQWHPLVQQQMFRNLMDVFSYPGKCVSTQHDYVLLGVLATLVDAETTLADPDHLLSELSRARLCAQMVAPEKAHFIVSLGSSAPDFTPSLGSLDSPEQGATIVLVLPSLESGERWRLTGPGIKDSATVRGISNTWVAARNLWCDSYPTGVDLILTDGKELFAIPRATHISAAGD